MVRGGRAGLLVLLPACAPWRYVDVVCDAAPPPEGQVLVQTLSCAEQIPDEGEGRVGADLYVATAYARGVLRHPQDALTLSDTGGLTLIDWAPWGEADVLHELVPLVGGGWVRPETWTLGPAEVEVRGPVGPLPDDAPVRALGQETTVRWVFDPERPCVRAEGADGWWLHGAGAVVRHGRSLRRGDVAIVSTGEVVHDLGGALRLGEGELCIGSPVEAWSAVGTQALEGISDGEVELASATGLVGRLPRGTVDARVPSDVREVRAVANDAAPGPWHPVGTDILLATGPRGSVELELPADGRARWVHWEHADGRTGTVARAESGLPRGATHRLHGTKWFTSATNSEMAMTLARVEDANGETRDGSRGLSLFYVETRDEAGALADIEVLRLKDKLGTRALPTAELELRGTPATLVGEPGRGVPTIATLINVTRLYNTICAVSNMRRGLALARDYAHRRHVFGRPLAEQPLHLETLAVGAERTPERVAALEGAFEALVAAASTGQAREIVAADMAFHAAIVDGLGSARLSAFFASLTTELGYYLLILSHTDDEPGHVDEAVLAHHRRLLDTALSGDVEGARAALAGHLHENHQRIRQILAPGGAGATGR